LISDAIRTGLAIELILVLVALEGVALTFYHRTTGRGPSASMLVPNLVAGAALLLAVRLALAGAWWGWLAGALLLALLAHLLDLGMRWAT
jgi:hypothetical protein